MCALACACVCLLVSVCTFQPLASDQFVDETLDHIPCDYIPCYYPEGPHTPMCSEHSAVWNLNATTWMPPGHTKGMQGKGRGVV